MIFPQLTELRLLYDGEESLTELGKVIGDIVHFRQGNITHLTTPALHDDTMKYLKAHVSHLEVHCSQFHYHSRLTLSQVLPTAFKY